MQSSHARRGLALAAVLAIGFGVTGAAGQAPPPPQPLPPPGLTPPQLPGEDVNGPVIAVTPPVQGNGAVRWTVKCPRTEQRCAGRVVIRTLRPVAGAGAVSAKATRVVLGVSRYRIRGGKSDKVRAKINRRGKRLLRKRKDIKVKATFTTRDRAGNVKRRNQVFTLHQSVFRHN